jgi:hypothetical protein
MNIEISIELRLSEYLEVILVPYEKPTVSVILS